MKKALILIIVLTLLIPLIAVTPATAGTSPVTGCMDWIWPVPGYYDLSSGYNLYRGDPLYDTHYGLDVPAPQGTSVLAVYEGTVVKIITSNSGWGNYILLKHTYNGGTIYTQYSHLNTINVSLNNVVYAGEKIGTIGNTGLSVGSGGGYHLDFMVRNTVNTTNNFTDTIDPLKTLFFDHNIIEKLDSPSVYNSNVKNYVTEAQNLYKGYVKYTSMLETDKTYYIVNYGSGKALNVYNGNNVNNTNVFQSTFYNDLEKQFQIKLSSSGYYSIRPNLCTTNHCKALDAASTASGANVRIYDSSSSSTQEWLIIPVGESVLSNNNKVGKYKIISRANTNLALTSYGNSNGTALGTSSTSAGNVFVSTYTGSENQHWYFTTSVGATPVSYKGSKTVADDIYRVNSISINANDIYISQTATSSAGMKYFSATLVQEWDIKYVGNGLYTLNLYNTSKYLDSTPTTLSSSVISNVSLWYIQKINNSYRLINKDTYKTLNFTGTDGNTLTMADTYNKYTGNWTFTDPMLGDVNGNGVIDAIDYAMCKQIVYGEMTGTTQQLDRADVNCDGIVDAKDYFIIKQMYFE